MSSAPSLGPDGIQTAKALTLHVKLFEGKEVKTLLIKFREFV